MSSEEPQATSPHSAQVPLHPANWPPRRSATFLLPILLLLPGPSLTAIAAHSTSLTLTPHPLGLPTASAQEDVPTTRWGRNASRSWQSPRGSSSSNAGSLGLNATGLHSDGGEIPRRNAKASGGRSLLRRVMEAHTAKAGAQSGMAAQNPKAALRLAKMIKFLEGKKRFSHWIQYFASTGLNDTVAQNLQKFGATMFIPNNNALNSIPTSERARMKSATKGQGMLQLLAFHIWFPAQVVAKLSKDKPGTQYSTADYPQKGLRAYKLKTTGSSEFNGRPTDKAGVVAARNFYFDVGPPTLTCFEAYRLMTPLRYV